MFPNPHSAEICIILRIFNLSKRNSCHHEYTVAIYAGNLSLSFEYKDVVYGSFYDQNENQLSQIAL